MIPVNTPLLHGNEKKYVTECIETGWISSEGPFVGQFEQAFSKYVNRDFGIAVSNGSAALDIALQAIDLNPGDEVIVPTFCIISPANSVIRQGGRPVFVDTEPHGFNVDVNAIEVQITNKTRAIIVAHIYNFPVDMDPIMCLCEKYNLILIEDAAELIGGSYKGRICGSFGSLSTFSFYPNKHITTGEGGMVCTDDPQLAERCKSIRNLCFQPTRRFVHNEIGWNYRLTNMQAALGLAQLERVNEHLSRKREIGQLYSKYLKELDCFLLPQDKNEFAENLYWVYPIVLNDQANFTNTDLQDFLTSKKIGTRPFFYPLHLQPVFNYLTDNRVLENSEKLYNRGFYIPSGLGLTDDNIKEVSSSIHEFVDSKS